MKAKQHRELELLTRVRVDPEDECILKSQHWHLDKYGYVVTYNLGVVFLHRMILDAPDGFQVDHINGDKLDNRRINLRLSTSRLNKLNTMKYGDGVKIEKRTGKYVSRLGSRWLGTFKTYEEALQQHEIARLEAVQEELDKISKLCNPKPSVSIPL